MKFRFNLTCGLALFLAVIGEARAQMAGDDQFPNSIIAPERATPSHQRPATSASPHHPSLLGREKFVAKLHRGSKMFATRGSSGAVLPTSLPRTPLQLPEGRATLTEPALPQQQAPSVVPGITNPVPNLPHGAETFQDRASRCTFQSSLYNVPGAVRSQYMGACVN